MATLVGKKKFLEQLFKEGSRPSSRWLDDRIADRSLPFVKIGGEVLFDIDQVRRKLAASNTISAK